jgi:hypothetical protein
MAKIVPDGAAAMASSGNCVVTPEPAGAELRRSPVRNAPPVTATATLIAAAATAQRRVVRRFARVRISTGSGQFTSDVSARRPATIFLRSDMVGL